MVIFKLEHGKRRIARTSCSIARPSPRCRSCSLCIVRASSARPLHSWQSWGWRAGPPSHTPCTDSYYMVYTV